MSKDDFPGKKRILLPVIHVSNYEQALHNSLIAEDTGCDGVFLINHHINHQKLIAIFNRLSNVFPKLWMGLNFLDLWPSEAFQVIPKKASGLWTDNGLIAENIPDQKAAETISQKRIESGWEGMYFGGVAFKYQHSVQNLEQVASAAAMHMDVITTSGERTGCPPDQEKILRMKSATGDIPLAIASGISAENIHLYPDCKFFLVATSISKDFLNFDPVLLKKLVKAAR